MLRYRQDEGSEGEASSLRLLDLAVPLIVTLLFLGYTTTATVPHPIASLPMQDKIRPEIVAIFPQAWGFFSRSPRDPNYAVYQLTQNGEVLSLTTWPATTASNFYGLSRRGRSQGVEVASLALGAPTDAWHQCPSDGDPAQCVRLQSDARAVPSTNRVPSPSACGEIFVAVVKPTAYAYLGLTPLRLSADKVVKMDVECTPDP